MKKRKLILLFGLAGILTGYAYEMRLWEDVDGKQYTGRFVRELFGKLTIEDDEENQTTFGIADLSDQDKKYIRVMIPPEIEVEVRTKSIQIPARKQFYQNDNDTDDYIVSALITKKSQRPFTSRLKAELFLVAEEVEGENHILLSRTAGDFLLLEENDCQYTFKSKRTRTLMFRDREYKGELYKGYLLVIASMQGDVLLTRSNLPNWMTGPEMVDKLRELSVRGAPSVRSRHFDKTGKKVAPPRPPYRTPTAK